MLKNKITKKFTHFSVLEFIWTVLPACVLIVVSFLLSIIYLLYADNVKHKSDNIILKEGFKILFQQNQELMLSLSKQTGPIPENLSVIATAVAENQVDDYSWLINSLIFVGGLIGLALALYILFKGGGGGGSANSSNFTGNGQIEPTFGVNFMRSNFLPTDGFRGLDSISKTFSHINLDTASNLEQVEIIQLALLQQATLLSQLILFYKNNPECLSVLNSRAANIVRGLDIMFPAKPINDPILNNQVEVLRLLRTTLLEHAKVLEELEGLKLTRLPHLELLQTEPLNVKIDILTKALTIVYPNEQDNSLILSLIADVPTILNL